MDRSLAVGESVNGVRSRLVWRSRRVEILTANERFAEAAEEVQALLPIVRSSGDRLLERDLLQQQADVLIAAGDPAGAYAARHAADEIHTGLATNLTSHRIADPEASMQRSQMESGMALLERQAEVQRLVVKRQRLLGFLLLAVLLLVLVIAAVLIWRFRAVRRLNQALIETGERLARAVKTDPLTGLGNRQAIPDPKEISEVAMACGQQCGVIVIEIDHFKRVNDQYGHISGDHVLKSTAATLRLALPAELEMVRWGGEEFLVLGTFDCDQSALGIAEKLRLALRGHPPSIDAQPYPVSISVGVCVGEGPIERWDSLVRRADRALYGAKQSGRNRVCIAA